MVISVPAHMLLGLTEGGQCLEVTLPYVVEDHDTRVLYTLNLISYLVTLHGISFACAGAVPMGAPDDRMMYNRTDKNFDNLLMRPTANSVAYILDGSRPWRKEDISILPQGLHCLEVRVDGTYDLVDEGGPKLPSTVKDVRLFGDTNVLRRWITAAAELGTLQSLKVDCDPLTMAWHDLAATPHQLAVATVAAVVGNAPTLNKLCLWVDDNLCESLFTGDVVMGHLTEVTLEFDNCAQDIVDRCVGRVINRCPNLRCLRLVDCYISRAAVQLLFGRIPTFSLSGLAFVASWELTGSTLYGGDVDICIAREALVRYAHITDKVSMWVSQLCHMKWDLTEGR